MGADDTPAPIPVGVSVTPMLVEVPILTEADLLQLEQDIESALAAHLRLRSTCRAILRKVRAAMARWSLPPDKVKNPGPGLRLVTDKDKKRR